MKKINLDPHTKEQANDYANMEAELQGFAVGSEKWKKSYKHFLGFALSTITLGRNPRGKSLKNPRDLKIWPEIFGSSGFAGTVAKNFKTSNGTGIPLEEAQDRIKSAVTSLTYMYLNGVYDIRTTTKGRKQGLIKDDDMSDLQLRGKDTSDKGLSSEEMTAENLDVLYNQLALTFVESAVMACLLPFFKMSKDDLQDLLDKGIQAEDTSKISAAQVAQARTELERRIRSVLDSKFANINIKDLILKD